MSKSRDIADSAATINFIDTVTSNVQTQLNTLDTALDNISVTSGTLTKTFTNGESASISLTSSVLAPVVSVTKEIPQTGSTNNSWDVNSTSQNYTRLNSAPATTLDWTASLASTSFVRSFSITSQETQPRSIKFNSDGTKVFILGVTGDDVNEYTLSSAYDISSASFVDSFSVSPAGAEPVGLAFNAAGTKMYVLDQNNRTIFQYSLSPGFDVSTASYDSVSFSVSAQDTTPTELVFNNNGTKMFVTGQSGQDVNEYSLSTAYDISSASFVDSFSVSGQTSRPQSIAFTNSGTKMYILADSSAAIYLYNLSSSYDVSTASYSSISLTTVLSSNSTLPKGITFNPDGTKLYVADDGGNAIDQYALPLALSLGTGSFASADVGKTIEANSGVFVLTATDGSYAQTTAPTSYAQVASGSWEMYGVVYNTTDGDLELSNYADIYNLASASYDSKTLSTSSQDSVPLDMAFNTDGTKVYMSGAASDSAYQYILATAWDVSTGTAAGSFSFASQDGNGRGIAFNNDGTKLYIAGGNADSIFQYSMSTAFDITTASYDSISLSISSQETEVMAIAFGDNGSKFYLIGTTNNSVFQYSLTTPYAINTATYTGTSFSVNSQEGYPSGLAFSDDGTKMFVCGYLNDKVYLYNLTTAWDLSTASYSSVDFSVASQQTTPQGMALGNGGAKMYIVGESPSAIFQYSIGAGVTAATGYQPVHTTASIDTTYWTDINSMTADQAAGDGNVYYAISTDDRTTWTVIDNTDGERDIVRNNAGTWQYNSNGTYASQTWVNGATNTELATIAEAMEGAEGVIGFVLSNASYDSKLLNVSGQLSVISGLSFNNDGTKLYAADLAVNTIFQYSLSTAYDISTGSYDSVSFSTATQISALADVVMGIDGTKMYALGRTSKSIYQYSMTTAYDISTASYDSVLFNVSGQEANPVAFRFNSDGTKMYVTGQTNQTVYQYSLSTAYDISSASYDSKSFSIASQQTSPYGLNFSNDGSKFFITGGSTPTVHQYDMSTNFDVSTASYNSVSFDLSGQDAQFLTSVFSADGSKFYAAGTVPDEIFQYSTNTPLYTNQMDKTQLDAVTDPNHIALSNDFDLSIILNMTSGATVPSSNGVAINYDANILNKGAVLGTDYDFDAPAQNKVRITALAANNLKVRVV